LVFAESLVSVVATVVFFVGGAEVAYVRHVVVAIFSGIVAGLAVG